VGDAEEEEELLGAEEEDAVEGDDVSAPLALDELEGLLSFPTQNLSRCA
jgi:hypothetical protein